MGQPNRFCLMMWTILGKQSLPSAECFWLMFIYKISFRSQLLLPTDKLCCVSLTLSVRYLLFTEQHHVSHHLTFNLMEHPPDPSHVLVLQHHSFTQTRHISLPNVLFNHWLLEPHIGKQLKSWQCRQIPAARKYSRLWNSSNTAFKWWGDWLWWNGEISAGFTREQRGPSIHWGLADILMEDQKTIQNKLLCYPRGCWCCEDIHVHPTPEARTFSLHIISGILLIVSKSRPNPSC